MHVGQRCLMFFILFPKNSFLEKKIICNACGIKMFNVFYFIYNVIIIIIIIIIFQRKKCDA